MRPDFYSLPTRCIENNHLTVEVLVKDGMRVVGLYPAGSDENLLVNLPNAGWETPFGPYHLRGGHRLWHAPEVFPRTYVPDNETSIENLPGGGLRLVQPTESTTGIHKSIKIELDSSHACLTLRHSLRNDNPWAVTCAPWAITQLPLGGVAVLPQAAPVRSQYTPNRQLVLWPYSQWEDPRLHFYNDFLIVDAAAQDWAVKVGFYNHAGWMGYLRAGYFFVKRFKFNPDKTYPDRNSNAQVYCRDEFVELESLGPLDAIDPGQEVTHTETWEIHPAAGFAQDIAGIRELVKSIQQE